MPDAMPAKSQVV